MAKLKESMQVTMSGKDYSDLLDKINTYEKIIDKKSSVVVTRKMFNDEAIKYNYIFGDNLDPEVIKALENERDEHKKGHELYKKLYEELDKKFDIKLEDRISNLKTNHKTEIDQFMRLLKERDRSYSDYQKSMQNAVRDLTDEIYETRNNWGYKLYKFFNKNK